MRRLALLLVLMSPCSKPLHCGRGEQGDASAPTLHASAIPIAPSSPAAPSIAGASPSSSSEGTDAMSPSERRAWAEAQAAYAELEPLIARGIVSDPKRPGEGDATDKCGRIDAVRPRLSARPEPEIKRLLEVSQRACSLDLALIHAKEALDQAQYSPSQASRRLACDLATREIAKARVVKPTDRRLRELDGRFRQTCP